MNGRKARALRKRSRDMFIEWLRTMTPEGEEPTKINKKNIAMNAIVPFTYPNLQNKNPTH